MAEDGIDRTRLVRYTPSAITCISDVLCLGTAASYDAVCASCLCTNHAMLCHLLHFLNQCYAMQWSLALINLHDLCNLTLGPAYPLRTC